METSPMSEALKQNLIDHPFVKGLEAHHLQYVLTSASEAEFPAGFTLLEEGKTAETFYLIQQGQVSLATFIFGRGLTTIQSLGDGELVGWSWLIPPHRWRFTALTISPTQAIVLDGKQLRQKCEEDHSFGYELMKRVAIIVGERLQSTRTRL